MSADSSARRLPLRLIVVRVERLQSLTCSSLMAIFLAALAPTTAPPSSEEARKKAPSPT